MLFCDEGYESTEQLDKGTAVQPLYTVPRRGGRGDASSLQLRFNYNFSARKCRRINSQADASSLDLEIIFESFVFIVYDGHINIRFIK